MSRCPNWRWNLNQIPTIGPSESSAFGKQTKTCGLEHHFVKLSNLESRGPEMSFRSEILFYMYEHGDLPAPAFRSYFPPDGECFDLSLSTMLADNEIVVMKDQKVIPATELPASVWTDKSYRIYLAPAGKNVALGGGRSSTSTDSDEVPF